MMTTNEIIDRDEVLKMARQAGIRETNIPTLAFGRVETGIELLEAFTKLVEERTAAKAAEREREACEKACQEERNDHDDQFKSYEDTHLDGWIDGCNSCISAIRARGEPTSRGEA